MVVNRREKRASVVDVTILRDRNIRKKEHKKFEQYQGLKEELETVWGVKVSVYP